MTTTGHIVVAPDKFKGSLTATEVADHVATGLHRARPDIDIRLAPIADGGDGTVDAVTTRGYQTLSASVTGPSGQQVRASLGRRDNRAVVELAQASGLNRLPEGRLDAMGASSRGTGELLRAALDAGSDDIVLGLGGSACTDGGAGMLHALGARLLDEHGDDIGPGGAALAVVRTLDLSDLDPRLRAARITLASDVDNPLLGASGAAAVYGPQKGATPTQVDQLERNLRTWAAAVARATGTDAAMWRGAGAAGGVGFAALAVLHATMRPGIDVVLELIDFHHLLPGASLVITGEGSLDEQSLNGKAPVGVASAAARHGVPTVAVAGRCTLSTAAMRRSGIHATYALTSIEPDPAICMREAGRLLETVGEVLIATELRDGPVETASRSSGEKP